MPYFIKHVPVESWLVYVVKGADENEALEDDEGEYLGCFDTDSGKASEIAAGPFNKRSDALEDSAADVEWEG